MLGGVISLSTVGFATMLLGVVLVAASTLSMVGRGLGRSSGRGPWLLLLAGGVMLLTGRLLLGT